MGEQQSQNPGSQLPEISHNPRLTITVLLIGVAIMLVGNGAFGTVLGVRANLLGFNIFVTGLIMSAYFVGYILGAYYCLKAVLEVGHIRVFAALAALASATALLHPLLPTPLAWGFLRVVAGFCLVGFYIIVESWLNSQATPKNRGKVFAIYMTVNLTALAAGQYLLGIDDPSGFVVFSIIAILFALALVPLSLSEVSAPALHIVPTLPVRQLYGISPVGVVTCFATGVIGAALFSMTPVFAQKFGLGANEIASLMSAIIIGGLVFQFPFGYFSDSHDRRAVIAWASLAAAIIGSLILFVPPQQEILLIAAAFLFGGFYFPLVAIAIARVNDLLEPSQILGATRGIMLVYGIGAALGPFIAGAVIDFLGPRAFFPYFSLILFALSGFVWWRIRHRAPLKPEEQADVRPIVGLSPAAAEFDPRTAAEFDESAKQN